FTTLTHANEEDVSAETSSNPQTGHAYLGTLRRGQLTRGVGWALAASAGYGIDFWLLGIYITPVFGGIMPIWIFRLTTICILAVFAKPARQNQNLRLPPRKVLWLVSIIGLLDTIAF